MAKKRIVIAGAGLAGLSAAWHLKKKGIPCEVFEKEPQVGGLCRSKYCDGFSFDQCGHLLHFSHADTFALVTQLLGDTLQSHERSAWIYSHRTYTHYPFQANFFGLPPVIVKECLLGFLHRSSRKNKGTFLDWIYATFGRGIARHFMVPYNTKFWTVSPRQLTCEWLRGFVPTPTLEEVIEGAIEDSHILLGYNTHFWYPLRGGISQLAEAFSRQIGPVATGARVCRIDLKRKEFFLSEGGREKFDFLISTIPLPEMDRVCVGARGEMLRASKRLRWNSIFNLNLGVERLDSDGKHWVYFPQQDTCFFRVGFAHNFSSHVCPAGKNSLYVEVSYSRHKPLDRRGIEKRIFSDLVKVGILRKGHALIAKDTNDIVYGYPLYDAHYAQARAKIIACLQRDHVIPCGRYGNWRYMSMEEAIRDGERAASYVEKHV